MNEGFEKIISEDESLSELLNDQSINVFSNFSKGEFTTEFIEYIQERYYSSFKEIYGKYHDSEKTSILVSLLGSVEHLATEKTKSLIAKGIEPKLVEAYENLSKLKGAIAHDKITEAAGDKIDGAISPAIIAIFNKLGDVPNIKEHKEKILGYCLDVCDMVSEVNPKKETMKYAIYNVIINNIEKVRDFGPLQQRFSKHRGTISEKRQKIDNKYAVGIFFFVLWIAFKIFRIMTR